MKKVLIANRGEIAVRIVRPCADYGVRSVAVYADPDLDALHARMADEAYGLDGQRPGDTYLNIDKLLVVAARCGADVVHPGDGFLSESATFAKMVIDAGLSWIGSPPAAIVAFGDEVQAGKITLEVGGPLIAGTAGPVTGVADVQDFAEPHGLPFIIRAAFGGGGRGLKIAWRIDEVADLYDSTVREAVTAFGRSECLAEQFLGRPRHLEAQVIADMHGHVLVLGTCDCSLQRRNQKLVEEAPAPFLSDEQRVRVYQAARDVCAKAGYVGAGTVEFLLSPSGTISFLEGNTRLQVEHPVTEETTGIDLVVEQLRIADGLPLSVTDAPAPRGHAFEFRINAEDVGRGFLSTPCPVRIFDVPSGPGVRVDSGLMSGSTVPRHIRVTEDQAECHRRHAGTGHRAGAGCSEGVPHPRCCFRAALPPRGDGGTGLRVRRCLQGAHALDRGRLRQHARSRGAARAAGRCGTGANGRRDRWPTHGARLPAELLRGFHAAAPAAAGEGAAASLPVADPTAVAAPISGTLQAWKVAGGEAVEAGSMVAVLAAMKMEMQVLVHRNGRLVVCPCRLAASPPQAPTSRRSDSLERST